jgi:hypothetical protein
MNASGQVHVARTHRLHEEGITHTCDRRVLESAGEVLQAHIRSSGPSFLAAHVFGLSPYASKARLARTDPVRA